MNCSDDDGPVGRREEGTSLDRELEGGNAHASRSLRTPNYSERARPGRGSRVESRPTAGAPARTRRRASEGRVRFRPTPACRRPPPPPRPAASSGASWRSVSLATVSLLLLGGCVDRLASGSRRRRHGAARVERDVRARFAQRAETLARTVEQLRAQPTPDDGPRRPDPRSAGPVRRRRRGRAAQPRRCRHHDRGPDGTAVAWAGRAQAVPDSRLDTGPTLVLAPGALGLRLVYVEPVRVTTGGPPRIIGALAAEQLLSGASTVDTRDGARGPVRDVAVAGDPDAATVPRRSHRRRATPSVITLHGADGRGAGRRGHRPRDPANRCARPGGGACWASAASRSPSPA